MVSIGVVGAGVGGLTLALALRQAGFRDIQVFARGDPGAAPDVGMILPPNGSRVLHALGLKDSLQACSGHPRMQLQRTWRRGFLLTQRPLGQSAEDRYGAPHYSIAKSDLVRVLNDACIAQAIHVHRHKECTHISQTGDQVIAEIDGEHSQLDVLIGCDGTQSTVRRELHYPQDAVHTGAYVWTGSAPTDALPRSLITDNVTTWMGPGWFLTHWLAPGAKQVELMFTVRAAAGDQSDDNAHDSAVALQPKAHLQSAHPHLAQLIDVSELSTASRVTEHAPVTQWYDRRVVLLGDACHALPPHLQQGAALAIEDAWVFSRMLERWEDEPSGGFDEYQRYRKVRVTRVRRASQFASAEWSLDAPRLALARNLKLSFTSRFLPELAMQQLDWLYGYDCIKGFE